jgi:hypothetical protein
VPNGAYIFTSELENGVCNGRQIFAVGIATICWAIWKMRNKVCFDGKKIKNPIKIICYACACIKF